MAVLVTRAFSDGLEMLHSLDSCFPTNLAVFSQAAHTSTVLTSADMKAATAKLGKAIKLISNSTMSSTCSQCSSAESPSWSSDHAGWTHAWHRIRTHKSA